MNNLGVNSKTCSVYIDDKTNEIIWNKLSRSQKTCTLQTTKPYWNKLHMTQINENSIPYIPYPCAGKTNIIKITYCKFNNHMQCLSKSHWCILQIQKNTLMSSHSVHIKYINYYWKGTKQDDPCFLIWEITTKLP